MLWETRTIISQLSTHPAPQHPPSLVPVGTRGFGTHQAATAAAAAAAPGARPALAKGIEAQDATYAIPQQHHLPTAHGPMPRAMKDEASKPLTQGQDGSQWSHLKPQVPSDLATEASPFCRVQEGAIGLVGTGNDSTHGVLVAPRGGGQQREGGQGDVVLAAGQAVPVVAVGAEPERDTKKEESERGCPDVPTS